MQGRKSVLLEKRERERERERGRGVWATGTKLQVNGITCLLPLFFVVSGFTQLGSKRFLS